MNPVKWLLSAEGATGKTSEIIRWWELRRIPYNLIVGSFGFISIIVGEAIGNTFLEPGEDLEEPFAMIIGIVLFAIGANTAYTLGWLVEGRAVRRDDLVQHRVFREKAFRAGLLFSIVLATVPLCITILLWIFHKRT